MPRISEETRAAVIADLEAGCGYREIAERHDVAIGSVTNIAKAAGLESANADQTRNAAERTRLNWAQRRGELVDNLGLVAAELLEKARIAPARDAQAFMTAVAIGVDKAQLLSGGATSRHEQLDAQRRRERIEGLGDELASRRAAKETGTGG